MILLQQCHSKYRQCAVRSIQRMTQCTWLYPGAPSVLQQLQAPWSPLAALLFLAPLVAALAFAETQADRFPALAEIRDLLAETVLPLLQKMSWWVRVPLAALTVPTLVFIFMGSSP